MPGSIAQCFRAFSLLLEPGDYEVSPVSQPLTQPETQVLEHRKETALDRQADSELIHFASVSSASKPINRIQSCGDDQSAPDVSLFYGRTAELATLHHWILVDRCRLIALSGQGGIGKTYLAAKLVEQIQGDFECVIWQSLHHAPSLTKFLTQLIQCVPRPIETDVSTTLDHLIAQAMDTLRSSRCLLVLDNLETILQGCDVAQGICHFFAGQYRADHEGYQTFFKRATETNHQSCLVLTSRELPQEIGQRAGNGLPVRNLSVKGLHVAQIQAIFQHKGTFKTTAANWSSLVERYAGNPLILKSVARFIQFLFGGYIAAFLNQDILLFDEIDDLLNQQLGRLSETEKDILIALTMQSNPGSFSEVRSHVPASFSSQRLLEGLNSLDMRSLLEIKDGCFSLLPLVATYVTERYSIGKL